MKTFPLEIMFVLLLFISSALAANQTSIQVVNIFENGSVETISSAGERHRVRLAGIQTVTFPHQVNSATVKRLKTLVLGRTVQINKIDNHLVLMSSGGMDIASRLLSEGVALIEETGFEILPMPVQQQLISAEEQARQYHRGIWQHQSRGQMQRYHQPIWPAGRLPSPITNAPVYLPDRK